MQQAALRDLIAEINLLSLMHESAVLIIKAYYSLKQLKKKKNTKKAETQNILQVLIHKREIHPPSKSKGSLLKS